MYPKDYFKIIVRHKILIMVSILLCGILAFVVSQLKPVTFESFVTLQVHRVDRQKAEDFQYDNYYAVEATKAVTETVIAWLASPNFVFEIYKAAQLSSQEDVMRLVKKIKAKQTAPHFIDIKFNYKDRKGALDFSNALISEVKKRIKELELTDENKAAFEITASEPLIIEKKYTPAKVTLLGLICGLFIGIALAFFWEYTLLEGNGVRPH